MAGIATLVAGVQHRRKERGAEPVPDWLVEELLQEHYAVLRETCEEGTHVTVKGFGRFEVRTRAAREADPPKGSGKIWVPEKTTLVFSESALARNRRNGA